MLDTDPATGRPWANSDEGGGEEVGANSDEGGGEEVGANSDKGGGKEVGANSDEGQAGQWEEKQKWGKGMEQAKRWTRCHGVVGRFGVKRSG